MDYIMIKKAASLPIQPFVYLLNDLLSQFVDYVHNLLPDLLSSLHSRCFAIYTDDRFGITLAQVYPLIGKVNFHTVNIIDSL
mgnify:CR=1 FL=1